MKWHRKQQVSGGVQRLVGQSLVEFALLLGLVGMLALGSGSLIVPQLQNGLTKINCALAAAQRVDAATGQAECSPVTASAEYRSMSANGGPGGRMGGTGCAVPASGASCGAAAARDWSSAGFGWLPLLILPVVVAVMVRRAFANKRQAWS